MNKKENKKRPKRLKKSETESLHLSEFSQGKPFEVSLNVLENKSLAQNQKRPSLFKRLFTKDRGSAQGLPDTPYVSEPGETSAQATGGIKLEKTSERSGETKPEPASLASAIGSEPALPKEKRGKTKKLSASLYKHRKTASEPLNKKGAEKRSVDIKTSSKQKSAEKPAVDKVFSKQKSDEKHSADDKPRKASVKQKSAEEKQVARKRTKKIIKIALIVVAVLALVALAIAGGSYLYKEYEKQQSNVELLKKSFSYLEESDSTLVDIDSFFQEKFNDSTVAQAEELLEKIPDAQKNIDSAQYYADLANEGLSETSKDKEAAECALNSIVARETMFSVSKERLQEDISAKKAMDAIDKAQTTINEANSLLAQSAKVIANTTTENVNSSTQYTTSARGLYKKALEQLQEVSQAYSKVDIQSLNEYVSKKIEACDAALASNAAILIQDKEVAEENNAKYNEADAEAVAIAEKLPRSFNQLVISAYQVAIKPLAEKYDTARSEVSVNDSTLRKYLNTETAS
jgi:predicted RNA-binding Zn ribbon-like protein